MPSVPDTAEPEASQLAARRPRSGLVRSVLWGCIVGASLACWLEVGRMVQSRNAHVVLEGRVYRTAQLNPEQLKAFVAKHQIRTVVNLRGRPISDWYPAEARTTHELGISQEDVTTSASHLPPPDELRRLIEVLDHSEYPILLHCQQGADRTGLAAALSLLLYSDAEYRLARHQCAPRYGHFPFFDRKEMDRFFDMYEEWLADSNRSHSPAQFRLWATTEYQPGKAVAALNMVDPPISLPVGETYTFVVRAVNRSRETWKFSPGTGVGVHVHYHVTGPDGDRWYESRAGFVDAEVAPGGSIEVKLPIPAPRKAGRHVLYADMTEKHIDFHQYGSEPLTYDWTASDPARSPGQ